MNEFVAWLPKCSNFQIANLVCWLFDAGANRVAERALPATIALHNALQSQLGVDNRIGATFGEVYCGAVGGVKRHGEYAASLPL